MDALLHLATQLADHPTTPLSASIPGRVAYVVSHGQSYASHGYAIRTQGIAQALNEHGFEALCFVRPGRPWELDEKSNAVGPETVIKGVRYIHSRWPHDQAPKSGKEHLEASVARFIELFRIYRPAAVLAASNYIIGLPAWIAAKRLGLPFYNEVRGFWELSRDAREPGYANSSVGKQEAERDAFVAKQAQKVFTLNQPMKAELEKRGIEAERLEIVPNGVSELPEIKPADLTLKAKLGIENGDKVVGYIGSFNPYEGLDTLIEACQQLITQGENIKLLLVGSEQPVTRATDAGKALADKPWLVQVGRVRHEEVADYYALIDTVVIPRKKLPVCELVPPMKATEALAYGKRLIVSDVAPLAEYVISYNSVETFSIARKVENLAQVIKKSLNTAPPKAADVLFFKNTGSIPDLLDKKLLERKNNENPKPWLIASLSDSKYKNDVIKEHKKEHKGHASLKNSASLVPTLSFPASNRFVESLSEHFLSGKNVRTYDLSNKLSVTKKEELIEKARKKYEQLKKAIPITNKKLLIVGHDLRFVQPYIEYLSKYYDVTIDKWTGLKTHDEDLSKKLLAQADIVWCEWCCGNAVYYSHNKRPGTKLFIRIHRFEYTTNFPTQVNWDNVDCLIFIAEGIKEKINEKFKINCSQSIIYNSFDVDSFVDASCIEKKDPYSLAMLGFIPKLKRADLALDLLNSVTQDNRNFKLFLKGRRPEEIDWVWNKERIFFDEIYDRVNEENEQAKTKKIIFESYDNGVANWIAKKGFLVSSSDIEGSHQAVAEAMAAGTIPIIIGSWSKDYKAHRLYPSEFIFDTISDAKKYIIDIIESGNYEKTSRRVQQFSIENFSPDIVMHSALDLLHKNTTKTGYVPIANSNNISILTDLNVNVVDGSSIWLMSIIDMLLIDRNNFISVFSKAQLNENSEFSKYKNFKRVTINEFPSNKEYTESEFVKFYENNIKKEITGKTIVRAGEKLTKEIFTLNAEILSKIIYYVVGDCKLDSTLLSNFDSILVQTMSAYEKIQKNLHASNVGMSIAILPPMIPDEYKPVIHCIDDIFKIVYTGKLCKDYKSLDMAKYANTLTKSEYFNIVASKFYKPDGDEYIKKTKSQLNSASNNGKATIAGPLSRDRTSDFIKESHAGWLLRDEKFTESSEISTKLLEYCALGKPVFLNAFQSNIDLLGDDYPLYVSSSEDIKEKSLQLINDPEWYRMISEYCSFVSQPYKMTQSLERLTPLLFSRSILPVENINKSNSFSLFSRCYKFLSPAEMQGIQVGELIEKWRNFRNEDAKFTCKPEEKNFTLRIRSLFSEPENNTPLIVIIKPNGRNEYVPGLKKTALGEYFEYIHATDDVFVERSIKINLDKQPEYILIHFKNCRLKSDALVHAEQVIV